jgi:hypothetical protein
MKTIVTSLFHVSLAFETMQDLQIPSILQADLYSLTNEKIVMSLGSIWNSVLRTGLSLTINEEMPVL